MSAAGRTEVSMNLRKVLGVCTVASAIILGAWAYFQPPHREEATAADAILLNVDAQQQTSVQNRNALIARVANLRKRPRLRVQAGAALPPLPPAGRPDLVIEEMRPFAELGSLEAMKHLSDALQVCANSKNLPDSILELETVEYVARTMELMDSVGQKADADAMKAEAAEGLELRKSMRDACRAIGVEESMAWIDWLEKAANAGDADAMRNYFYRALMDYQSAGDAAQDIDEVKRRKELAFKYGGELMASGDCGILTNMAIYAPSPLDAAIYIVAANEQAKRLMIASGAPDLNNSLLAIESASQTMLARLRIKDSANIRDAANFVLNTYCGN